MWGQLNEPDGRGQISGTKDEAVGFKVEETNMQSVIRMHGIDGRQHGSVACQRVVVAVNDGNRILLEQWMHGDGMFGIGAEGDKALPNRAASGRACEREMERGIWDQNRIQNGGRSNAWLKDGCFLCDNGDGLHGGRGAIGCGKIRVRGWDQVQDGKITSGKDTVKSLQAEGAFSMEEVGNVGMTEARGAGQLRACEQTATDAAQDFQAKIFLQKI